ncbi:MAG: hypothetical protein V3R64_04225, partial [Sphingomonadales bacterium]
GHTPGSTAYLVRTKDGPKLIIGDAVRIRVEWDHGIPQKGAADRKLANLSAERLRVFAQEFPEIEVFLGHQP